VKHLAQTDYNDSIREFLSSGQIKKREDTQTISYLLSDENLFFLTGYKVLQGQHKNGFLKCVKVLQNGKIKLNYDIESFKPLQVVLPMLTPAMFLTIIYNLVDIFKEIRNNGFIQCENVFVSPDLIYIDHGNLRVFLLYLPLKIQTFPDSLSIFENSLKKMIFDLLSDNLNINDDETSEIREEFFHDTATLDALQEYLHGKGHPISAAIDLKSWVGGLSGRAGREYGTGNSQSITLHQTHTTKAQDHTLKNDAVQQSLISKLLRRSGKTEKLENIRPEEIDSAYSPGDNFKPQIALVSQNASERVIFVINRPEFILGKDAKAADGVIHSNQFVSGVHCKIIWNKGRYFVVDMDSLNHTYINDTPITPNAPIPLHVRDVVKLANAEFIVQPLSDMQIVSNNKTAPDPDMY
jgi:hypothetical protein